MHARQFLHKTKKKLAPIYVLYGNETYFIQKVLENIESLIEKQVGEYDRNVFDMETTPVEEAILDAESIPFFSEKKLIIIQRAFFLTGQNKKQEVEHQLDTLEQYVQNSAEFTTLVIIVPSEKLDSRKKLVKLLKESSEMIDCSSPKAHEMHDLIIDMAKAYNLNLTEEIIELLIERVGERIEALTHEIEKLKLYFADQQVTFDEAEKIISTHTETSSFALIDSVTELNLSKSLAIVQQLKKQNEEPIALLALLSSQIRLILQCKLLKQKGYQEQQIAKYLQVHPFAVKMALRRERLFTSQQLKSMLIEATNTDEGLKTGKEPWLTLEFFIRSIISIKLNDQLKQYI